MNRFKKGDILRGTYNSFPEAYHPIVFINGPEHAPLAVILTHSRKFSCNVKLSGNYDCCPSYFVAHLIQKMAEWGPYNRVGELNTEDLKLVESHISSSPSISWKEYERYTKKGCPIHGARATSEK